MKSKLHLRNCAIATAFLLVSCASEIIPDSDPTPGALPGKDGSTLYLNVRSNDFTRAGEENENTINTLYLALYKSGSTGQTCVDVVEAQKEEERYVVKFPTAMTKPDFDKVVAYANITEAMIASLKKNEDVTTSSLVNNNDLFMSSAVYFNDATNEKSLVNFIPVTEANFEGTPLRITLERVAAKVTVVTENPTLSELKVKDSSGKDVTLTLSLESWGLTGIDTKSYLLKHVSMNYSDIASLFPNTNDWNKLTPQELHWAESILFDNSSGSPAVLIPNDATNTPGQHAYFHESTRTTAQLKKDNHKPSIVIVGQYKKGGNNMGTFYRLRSSDKDIIYTDAYTSIPGAATGTYDYDKYITKFAEEQTIVYDANDSKPSFAKYVLGQYGSYPHLVMPYFNENPASRYHNGKGLTYTSKDQINEALQEIVTPLEKYTNGKCIFIIPIEHDKVSALVRNHHYKYTINKISGFGRGIGDLTKPISDIPDPDIREGYSVNLSVNVNNWVEHEKIVNIPENVGE